MGGKPKLKLQLLDKGKIPGKIRKKDPGRFTENEKAK